MYNIGDVVSVKGIVEPVSLTDIIRAGRMIGYAGTYKSNSVSMTISWIPLALIKPF